MQIKSLMKIHYKIVREFSRFLFFMYTYRKFKIHIPKLLKTIIVTYVFFNFYYKKIL